MDYADLQMKARSESISGIGSSLSNTVTIRTWLERKLISLGIASLGDIPCGDYHWMKGVTMISGICWIRYFLLQQERQQPP